MIIGGEKKTIVAENEPTYSATYEIESPDVLTNTPWGAAVDQGRWPGQVAPLHQEPPPRPLPAHPALARRMRLVPVGLAVIAALQAVAAIAAYPVLTVAVSLVASLLGNMVSPDAGARTAFFLFGLPTAFGVLLLAGVFMAVPLGVCVSGAFVVGRLGCRRGAKASARQLRRFGAALVVINVAALGVGILIWPAWFYSEKLATLIPIWPLDLAFALNALLDAALVGTVLRSQLRAR
jgi:hypothetical protein